MNVIVSNNQQAQVTTLDIDVIKSISGTYSANELVEMFKNFFYSKMVLDVTAIKDFENIQSYKTLSQGLDPEKIILFIPEGSNLCTAFFLAKLVTLGMYNFTTNIEGVKYLMKKSNTYEDVKEIQEKGGGGIIEEIDPINPDGTPAEAAIASQKPQAAAQVMNRTIKLGIKNVTDHAGATSLAYMIKKELMAIYGQNRVVAIEVNKNDFQFFNDPTMVSTSAQDLRNVMDRYVGMAVIIVDLNDYENENICDEVIYLMEPSTLMLNKLMRRNKNILEKIRGKKTVLNKSLLSSKDITELEYEAGMKIFYNLPPLNDRQRNNIINELLSKVGLVQFGKKDESNKIFGLFRR